MLTLYSYQDSGNSYKPRLLLAYLKRPFRLVDTSSRDGSTRTPEFLARNANGKVPLLELEDGRHLAESNAILLYLADGSRFLPADAYERAKVHEWLFFEQYDHEPTIAVRRALMTYPERADKATPERMAALLDGGNRALGVMEARLAGHDWLAGDQFSVADISLFGYTHDAHVGGFDLTRYPGVLAWVKRFADQPGHVGLEWRPEL
ncbi:MAG TPA: glutathione S-transferase family protein [Afifellaceae bacterium]|nr:glutathione S-transferase family protein [Afifellaceae bacterium]